MDYTFNEYQKEASLTAKYPIIGKNYIYPVLGLAGEVGELLNKVKKIFRDDEEEISKERKKQIEEELGDILWYLSEIATKLGISLQIVALNNNTKLQSRKQRNRIQGEGDNR